MISLLAFTAAGVVGAASQINMNTYRQFTQPDPPAVCTPADKSALIARMDEHAKAVKDRATNQAGASNFIRFLFVGSLAMTDPNQVNLVSFPFQGKVYAIPERFLDTTNKLAESLSGRYPQCF